MHKRKKTIETSSTDASSQNTMGANQDDQGLDWDQEENETEVFEKKPSPLRALPSTDSFLEDADTKTRATEPNPALLALTGQPPPAPMARGLSTSPFSKSPFPGTPILPQPQHVLPPASPYPTVSASTSGARGKYYVAFALLLFVTALGVYVFLPRSGMLQVSVSPMDAYLEVNGVTLTDGPLFRINERAGVYRLTVSRPGYDTSEQRVQIAAGQEGHLDVTLRPSTNTGFDLTSVPSGLLVWLDGQPLVIDQDGRQATTDLHASRITPGPHVVELSGDPRYQPWREEFVQEAEHTLRLHADLVPVATSPKSQASPAVGHVRRPRAATKASRTSDEGIRHRSQSASPVPPSPGKDDPFEDGTWQSQDKPMMSNGQASMDSEAKCIVSVSSKPWAEVSIDGKPTGNITPLVNYALPCGRHRFTFKNADLMIERNERITLEPGHPFKKIFSLVETDP